MNVLIIGSGGREHAIAWKVVQSPRLSKLYIAPGNAGTMSCGKNVALDLYDHPAIIQFCKKNQREKFYGAASHSNRTLCYIRPV